MGAFGSLSVTHYSHYPLPYYSLASPTQKFQQNRAIAEGEAEMSFIDHLEALRWQF